jgi:2-polyprenyl-6-methoxyphenol hydroxylase-like FAD-dependent oxidoreductase
VSASNGSFLDRDGTALKTSTMNQERALEPQFDVIIVGGRPAGASLAARLGERGLRVLVVDRARFPSGPGVPSCPLIYPAAMQLLEEIGVEERSFATGALAIRDVVIEFGAYFDARLRMPESRGRDYVYMIDRVPFDLALWNNLARFPTVTARSEFSVDELIRDDDGGVAGIVGRAKGGEKERILAGCVVGADGRFSAVARKAGARIVEDRSEHASTVYFADWEGVAPYDGDPRPLVHIYATGRGTDVLHFPLPNGTTTICTHMRADRVDVRGDAEAFYLGVLQGHAGVRRRLAGARRVTDVIGLKRIANRYLQAGGPGWVLAGDALHHKDPVDGQGIYDALVETKILAEALASVHAGERSFEQAVAWYERRVREETHGMFEATLERLKKELYEEPPAIVIRTLIRWLLNDPEYHRRFLGFLCRDIPAEGWLPPSLLRDAAARGALGDLRRLAGRLLGRRPARPSSVPGPAAAE